MATKKSGATATKRRKQKLSQAGVRFISEFEGFRSELHNDPAGHCSIGFGHLVHLGKIDGSEPAEFKKGITRTRARELLRADADVAQGAVNKEVEVPLSQQQFDALVSFVFNVGTGAFRESTLLRLLNKGDYEAVPKQLNRFVKGGGKTLPGLVRRRKEEGELFASTKVPDGGKPAKGDGGKPATGEVHRDLHLTKPVTKGPDVKALQQALNKVAGQFPRIVTFRLVEDGKLGNKTLQAAVVAAHVLGVTRPRVTDIEKMHVIDQRIQGLMRRPATRTDAQKARSKERCEALRRKLDQKLSLTAVSVTVRGGPTHWGGSNDVMEEFVEPFMVKRGLRLGSGKRTPAENKRVGGSKKSDHLTTKRRTAARDFPTFKGEDDARALAKSMGFESWRPNSFDGFEFSAGGHSFRVQILWGAAIDHGDHVHVGISAA
jgi:lysozyme